MRFWWWEDAQRAAFEAASRTGRRMRVYLFDGRWCVSEVGA